MNTTSWSVPVPAAARRPSPASDETVAVEVLACGQANCGDDGLAAVVEQNLRRRLPADTRFRLIGRLEIDHLLAIAEGARTVIVDVAAGVRGGRVIRLPLDGLVDRIDELRPRRCEALGFPEVLGVAGVIRGHPLHGQLVLVGGVRYAVGSELSPSVQRAVWKVIKAVEAACAAVRTDSVAA